MLHQSTFSDVVNSYCTRKDEHIYFPCFPQMFTYDYFFIIINFHT